MKKLLVLICLSLSICTISACGSKGMRGGKNAELSSEFTLETGNVEGGIKLDGVLFAKEVTKAKVSSLSADKNGVALGFSLDEEETEKLINLFQEADISGVEADQSEYNSAAMRDSYGYTIDFVDGTDRFYMGVSRLTCFTTAKENYLAIREEDGGTKLYRIGLSDDIVSFLNDVAAKNYDPSKGRTGWFDKVFK